MYEIGEQEIQAVARVIRSGKLFRYLGTEFGEVASFERDWARKIGAQFALGVNSGTSALICGLVGLGVGPGDEVIVPAYTFISTALAVLAVGAIPIIAEVDDSLTIDPADIKKKITPRTKTIIPVHMNGLPSDMDAIMKIAHKSKVSVLEDCCQADGGSYKGRRLGSIGDAGGFSFNYYKIIGCGDGGAMVTSDDTCYQRALIHHDSGCAFRPHAGELTEPLFGGQNYRMLEIMAAVMNEQLKRLDKMLSKMRQVKKRFVTKLDGHPELRFIKHNDLDGDCGTTVGFLFESQEVARGFIAKLGEQGVGASTPADSGRHIYCNWEVVMKKRGAHHPKMDPFKMAANRGSKVKYSADMCPRTLDLLGRTVFLGTSPKWTAKDSDPIIKACERAARA